MPYIGKSPVGGGFHKLDALTASATATYALTLGSAAYFPETANQLLVSLNGVIQAPQDSFTVSGSNLVFDTALTSSDSIDFVVALGDVLGVGSVTDGAVTTAKIQNGAVTAAKISSLPTGSVLQVVQAVKTDTQEFNANSYSAISGLAAVITPTSTSSKILVQAVIHIGTSGGNEGVGGKLYRNSSEVTGARGDAAGSRDRNWFHGGEYAGTTSQSTSTPMFLDSPSSTSQLTYEVYCRSHSTGYPAYINRSEDDSDDSRRSRVISTLTLMEIAG